MIRVRNIEVNNIQNAIRGARNPLESWDQIDSYYDYQNEKDEKEVYIIGDVDMDLLLRLIKAGTDHSKFMRQIFVSMDITAPLYFFKEFDTYKVATVANSTSTMHTLHKHNITTQLFSVEDLDSKSLDVFKEYCKYLETLRISFLETKDKVYWRQLIQMLPDSFNQTRTWTGNYQTLRNMYHNRKNHKLTEWKEFCSEYIEKLPYSELIVTKPNKGNI